MRPDIDLQRLQNSKKRKLEKQLKGQAADSDESKSEDELDGVVQYPNGQVPPAFDEPIPQYHLIGDFIPSQKLELAGKQKQNADNKLSTEEQAYLNNEAVQNLFRAKGIEHENDPFQQNLGMSPWKHVSKML